MVDALPSFQIIDLPPSLKDKAFQAIKQHILAHKLKPGGIYSEQAIARELQISKTPIHQALADLQSRGFLTILPRRGFQVHAITEKVVRVLFEFRHVLEPAIIRLVADKLDQQSIKELESWNDRAAKTQDWFQFLKYDRALHLHLASLTDNQFIIDALENIKDLCDWVGAEVVGLENRPEEAIREHAEVIEKLKTGDADGAAHAMAEHLRVTEARFVANVSAQKIPGQEEGGD